MTKLPREFTTLTDGKSVENMHQCPFCAGRFVYTELPDGDSAMGHLEPSCEQFDTLSANDYLDAVANKLGWSS